MQAGSMLCKTAILHFIFDTDPVAVPLGSSGQRTKWALAFKALTLCSRGGVALTAGTCIRKLQLSKISLKKVHNGLAKLRE